jgi:hypothetical protein
MVARTYVDCSEFLDLKKRDIFENQAGVAC